MKNLKSRVLQATFIMSVVIGTSSFVSNKPEEMNEISPISNQTKLDETVSKKDAKFLVKAAEIHLEQISLGKLAQEKGSTQHVKDLGKMMEKEHTKSQAALTALAKTKNVTLPNTVTNDDAMEDYQELKEESGNDFEKEFSELLVEGHEDAIKLFEKASKECTDPDIKTWATATLPTLRTHLEHSLVCQKQCKKM